MSTKYPIQPHAHWKRYETHSILIMEIVNSHTTLSYNYNKTFLIQLKSHLFIYYTLYINSVFYGGKIYIREFHILFCMLGDGAWITSRQFLCFVTVCVCVWILLHVYTIRPSMEWMKQKGNITNYHIIPLNMKSMKVLCELYRTSSNVDLCNVDPQNSRSWFNCFWWKPTKID